MRRVPLSMATQTSTLEPLYFGTPQVFTLASISASQEILPGMVMAVDGDGNVDVSNGDGFIGLSALYKTTLIDDTAATGHFAVWEQGRYKVNAPAFNEDTLNDWANAEDGSSVYLYATASGTEKGKLEPGSGETSRKPVAVLLNKTATQIEIQLLPSA